jgi:hypothetical protein
MITAGYIVGALALLSTAGLTAWSHAHPDQHNRFMHDGPVMIMYGLGAWLFLPIGWLWSVTYLMTVALCNLWFVVRVCPHCVYHDRTDGPSLYCALTTRIADKGDPQLFASRFRHTAGVLAINWVLPIIGGIVALRQMNEWAYGLTLLAVFGLIAFYLVPTSAKPSCERCLNKETCPRGKHVKDTV